MQRQSIIATLAQVGIDLIQPVFTHGQFNVALSRERFFDSVSVLPSVQLLCSYYTDNVVYKDVLI